MAHILCSLSEGINNIKGLKVDLDSVETNIVSILILDAYSQVHVFQHFKDLKRYFSLLKKKENNIYIFFIVISAYISYLGKTEVFRFFTKLSIQVHS